MNSCRTGVFQHDNALCHAVRAVTNWLQQHQIQDGDWPGNSPDYEKEA